MERRDSITDYAIIIISAFHAYTVYYGTWEDALQSYMSLTGYLKDNDYTLIREVILTFKNEIKAFCDIK